MRKVSYGIPPAERAKKSGVPQTRVPRSPGSSFGVRKEFLAEGRKKGACTNRKGERGKRGANR